MAWPVKAMETARADISATREVNIDCAISIELLGSAPSSSRLHAYID
jgi:hypothetical protein